MITKEKPPLTAEFVHSGVKGMKWGVRKGYTQRQSRQAQREIAVGKGGGTRTQKLRVHGATSVIGLAAGPKSSALRRGISRQKHADRLKNGQESAADLLRLYGTFKLSDIRRTK